MVVYGFVFEELRRRITVENNDVDISIVIKIIKNTPATTFRMLQGWPGSSRAALEARADVLHDGVLHFVLCTAVDRLDVSEEVTIAEKRVAVSVIVQIN